MTKMITILLNQSAIEDALKNYIGETTLGVDLSQMDVSIKFTPGRGKNGLRAEANLVPIDEVTEVPSDPEEKDVARSSATPSEQVEEKLSDDLPALGPFD